MNPITESIGKIITTKRSPPVTASFQALTSPPTTTPTMAPITINTSSPMRHSLPASRTSPAAGSTSATIPAGDYVVGRPPHQLRVQRRPENGTGSGLGAEMPGHPSSPMGLAVQSAPPRIPWRLLPGTPLLVSGMPAGYRVGAARLRAV